jgi:hypothetical protein
MVGMKSTNWVRIVVWACLLGGVFNNRVAGGLRWWLGQSVQYRLGGHDHRERVESVRKFSRSNRWAEAPRDAPEKPISN